MAGRKFGKSFLNCQTKTIQISTYNYNLLAESIHLPNIFAKCSKQVNLPPNIPAIWYHIHTYVPNSYYVLNNHDCAFNNHTQCYVHWKNIYVSSSIHKILQIWRGSTSVLLITSKLFYTCTETVQYLLQISCLFLCFIKNNVTDDQLVHILQLSFNFKFMV